MIAVMVVWGWVGGGEGGVACLLRAKVVRDTVRKTARGISGISLAILGDSMRTKNVSPDIATSLAVSRSPMKGYVNLFLIFWILLVDATTASLPALPVSKVPF